MRSPAIVSEPPFASDMASLSAMKSSLCVEESDSNSEPDMESTGNKSVKDYNISIDKDSGVDSDNDFKAPDQQLLENIVAMVETYFSNENLLKDEFVLKHIRRNKDGFISLKLLSSFRKVKALTKSWKVVAHCVKMGSKSLELNEDGTKIRRKAALPSVDGDKYSRTVIAFNFPEATDDINGIAKVFSKFGEIALIRMVKPGSSSVIPNHLLNKIKENHDLSKTIVATIEYYNKSGVDEAIKHLDKSSEIKIIAMKGQNIRQHRSSLRWSESSDSNERREYQRNYGFQRKSVPENRIDISLNINSKKQYSRQKSKSCSVGVETKFAKSYVPRNGNNFQTKNLVKFVPIIRMPFGPDGTNGFTTHKNHRSRTL